MEARERARPLKQAAINSGVSIDYESHIYCEEALYSNIVHRLSLFLGTCTFLGKQDSLDVGQDTPLGNSNTSEEFVELLIVPVQSKV